MTSTERFSRSKRFRRGFLRHKFCCSRAAGTLPIATSERLRWIEWWSSSERFHEEISTHADAGRQLTHAGRELADFWRRRPANRLGEERNRNHERQRQKTGPAVEAAPRQCRHRAHLSDGRHRGGERGDRRWKLRQLVRGGWRHGKNSLAEEIYG